MICSHVWISIDVKDQADRLSMMKPDRLKVSFSSQCLTSSVSTTVIRVWWDTERETEGERARRTREVERQEMRALVAENATTQTTVMSASRQRKVTSTRHAQRHVRVRRPRHNGLLKRCTRAITPSVCLLRPRQKSEVLWWLSIIQQH